MRVGTVGTAQITPPLPGKLRTRSRAGFFVPAIHSFDVRFAPDSGHWDGRVLKGRKRPKADLRLAPGRIGTCWRDRVWYRVPHFELREDAFHNVGIINECNDKLEPGTRPGVQYQCDRPYQGDPDRHWIISGDFLIPEPIAPCRARAASAPRQLALSTARCHDYFFGPVANLL
jgi:hypothetical protein